MTPPDGERIARVEEQIGGLRDDVQNLTVETERTRHRLHSIEGTLSGMIIDTKVRAEIAADASAKTLRWVKLGSLIVAIAGVVGPFVYTGHWP